MTEDMRRFFVGGARWTARLLTLVASGPFLYFLVIRSRSVIPRLSWGAPNGMPLFVAWVAVLVGLLVAFRWERTGGLITGVAGLAVGALGLLGCGRQELTTCMLVSVPYLLSGLILVGCHYASCSEVAPDRGRHVTV